MNISKITKFGLAALVVGICTGMAGADEPNATTFDQLQARLDAAEARIAELGLQLPDPPSPGGTYQPVVQVGDLCYVSGHGPVQVDGTMITGKVGSEMGEEDANQAARVVGLAILATLKSYLGDLDRVTRLVKVLGMVNCTPDFGTQPNVINGFSDLMVEVFGEQGRAARSAVGMGALPGNIPVEIEVIVQVSD